MVECVDRAQLESLNEEGTVMANLEYLHIYIVAF